MSELRETLTIVGGGFTGAVFAIHLARTARRPLDIVICEPREELGLGLAYGVTEPDWRINVPSDRMNIFDDDKTHFTRWLQRSGELDRDFAAAVDGGDLYPRRYAFGAYMADTLAAAAAANPAGCTIRHRRARVENIERRKTGFALTLDDGASVNSDRIAICTSHGAPAFPWPLDDATQDHPHLVLNPWDANRLDGLPADAETLIIGTGLTMADVVMALRARGVNGRITALSRRGLLPQNHGVFDDDESLLRGADSPRTARALLRLARARVAEQIAQGRGWHPAVDAVRRALPTVWGALPLEEKQKAVRRLRPFWDTHRFRIAPQVGAAIAQERASGDLTIRRGHLRALRREGDRLVAEIDERGGATALSVDAVVSCLGPDHDLRRSATGGVRALIEKGLVEPDALRLGLACDEQCRAIDVHGRPQSDLLIVGPLSRATFGEMMGVPELANQAAALAQRLAAETAALAQAG